MLQRRTSELVSIPTDTPSRRQLVVGLGALALGTAGMLAVSDPLLAQEASDDAEAENRRHRHGRGRGRGRFGRGRRGRHRHRRRNRGD
jgi:hypothetical protein